MASEAHDAAAGGTMNALVRHPDDLAHQVVARIRANGERDATRRRADLSQALSGGDDHEAVEDRLLADVSARRPAREAVTISRPERPGRVRSAVPAPRYGREASAADRGLTRTGAFLEGVDVGSVSCRAGGVQPFHDQDDGTVRVGRWVQGAVVRSEDWARAGTQRAAASRASVRVSLKAIAAPGAC
ncbi:hypothetical protein GCM10028783_01040 [Modestobacter muralis]